MIRLTMMFLLAAFVIIAATPSEARQKRFHAPPEPCRYDNNGRVICTGFAEPSVSGSRVANNDGHLIPHPIGCPRTRYCGCGASVEVFGRPIKGLFLAAAWRKFPSAQPAPGMAAWRYGHVFIIQSVNGDGTVVAIDHNSGGHRSRIHTVSLRGYHVVNPHG